MNGRHHFLHHHVLEMPSDSLMWPFVLLDFRRVFMVRASANELGEKIT